MKRLLTACLAVLALALMLPVDPAVSAYRIGDIACESSEDTGTGALDLDGAYREYQSFSEAGIADGDSFPYHLRVGSGETTKFETGIATFTDGTPDSITRDVDQSSDGAATALDVQDPSVICISLTSRHFTAHRYMIGEVIEIANPELPDGCLWPDGSNVSRSTYSALLDALSVQLEGDTTDTSDEIANTSKDVSVLGLVGKKIEGAGIPADTTITAATANTITLSANATATATDVPLRIFGYGNGDGATTFGIPDLRGRAAVTRDNIAGTSANRLTGVSGSLDGDVLGNAGGGETFTIAQANLPNVNFSHTLTLPNHAHDDTFTLPNHAHSETLTLPNHAHGHTLTLPDHIHSETLTLPAHSHPDTFTLPAHTHPESLTLPAHSHPDTLAAPAHTHTMAHTHTVSALITSGADTTQSGANHNFTSGTPTTSASSAANTGGASATALTGSVSNNTSFPAISGTIDANTSFPAITGAVSNNTSFPAIDGAIGDPTTNPAITGAIGDPTTNPDIVGAIGDPTTNPAIDGAVGNPTTNPAIDGLVPSGGNGTALSKVQPTFILNSCLYTGVL